MCHRHSVCHHFLHRSRAQATECRWHIDPHRAQLVVLTGCSSAEPSIPTGTPAPITLEANPMAIGPIGFTSDTNTNAPLFAITSFIVPAPRQQNADGTLTPIELSWWFLQAELDGGQCAIGI